MPQTNIINDNYTNNKPPTEMSRVFEFDAIGTHWQIHIHHIGDRSSLENLQNIIHSRVNVFESTYSRFKEESIISQMKRKAGNYIFPADAIPLLNLYKDLYKATEGLVTPLIGGMMADVGYDEAYTLVPKKNVCGIPDWHDVMKVSETKISTKYPVHLDFGALGKGYCIDLVSEIIEKNGVKNYTVDAGGDIRTRAERGQPLIIGLENPDNLSEVIGTLKLDNKSICASSGSRRKWDKYHHIMNPITKKSQDAIKATWVIADTTLLADALATALFFVPPSKVSHLGNFEYIILTKSNELFYSPHLNISF